MKTRLETIMQAEERRAQKVQDLNARLQDPEISDYVAKLFGEPITLFASSKPSSAPANGNGHKLSNLTITPAIKFIAESLPQPFLIDDIVQMLLSGGFRFGKREPHESVRDSVYLLCRGEKPIFKLAEPGQGGKPNKYERF